MNEEEKKSAIPQLAFGDIFAIESDVLNNNMTRVQTTSGDIKCYWGDVLRNTVHGLGTNKKKRKRAAPNLRKSTKVTSLASRT